MILCKNILKITQKSVDNSQKCVILGIVTQKCVEKWSKCL